MEKTFNPYDGSVHLIDKRKKRDPFYQCVCGKSTGLLWENTDQDTPLGCLVCLMHEEGKVMEETK